MPLMAPGKPRPTADELNAKLTFQESHVDTTHIFYGKGSTALGSNPLVFKPSSIPKNGIFSSTRAGQSTNPLKMPREIHQIDDLETLTIDVSPISESSLFDTPLTTDLSSSPVKYTPSPIPKNGLQMSKRFEIPSFTMLNKARHIKPSPTPRPSNTTDDHSDTTPRCRTGVSCNPNIVPNAEDGLSLDTTNQKWITLSNEELKMYLRQLTDAARPAMVEAIKLVKEQKADVIVTYHKDHE